MTTKTEPLPLTTPQMECLTCRATVRITGKGTIAQHTRSVAKTSFSRARLGWMHTSVDKRCPASFTAAPAGAHAAWLRAMSAERLRTIESTRAERRELMTKVAVLDARIDAMKARADEIDAALAAIGASP